MVRGKAIFDNSKPLLSYLEGSEIESPKNGEDSAERPGEGGPTHSLDDAQGELFVKRLPDSKGKPRRAEFIKQNRQVSKFRMSRRTLLLNGPSAKATLTLPYGIISGNGLCAFIVLSMSVALLSPGCNSPDRVLTIPAAEDTAPKSIEGIENYPVALSAIVSVMVRELNLPEPHGQVYFYRDAGAYQAALGAEIKSRIHRWEAESTEIKRVQHQLEFELFKRTVDLAMHTAATTVGQKVFVAEWTIMRIPWQKRFRILAHELAHVVASSLAAGHVQRMHRWLMEGFAEWVSFKVVDRLGTQNFFTIKCGKHAAIK